MTDNETRTREQGLRRMAARQGLRLVKSRTRDPHAIDYGKYWLIGAAGDYSVELVDLDAVERQLRTDYYIDIDIPERQEIGRAVSPVDLAHALAHVLAASERHGSPRPRFELRADENGMARDLTPIEQKAFDAALERASDDVRGDEGER